MSNIFKRIFSSKSEEIPAITTDLHSHLIPGIDDGSKSMEDSIQMIEAFIAQGYTKLITTPHIMSHRYPNTRAIIEEGLVELKKELKARDIVVEIEVASEYYL
ncbi:capsular biosynthesis protein, partial [bacterium]|nr:capsular biosynthesis protein [bacterium]